MTSDSLHDRVIELAHSWRSGHYTKADRAELALAVAALAVAHERERCAKLCNDEAHGFYLAGEYEKEIAARDCAAAIRARKGEI